eukprot:400870-Amphidinium_carterae.1
MPPIVGFDDGSGPNRSPSGSKNLFNSSFRTPASTHGQANCNGTVVPFTAKDVQQSLRKQA